MLLDALGEFVQGDLVELSAGLEGVALDCVDVDVAEALGGVVGLRGLSGTGFGGGSEHGIDAATKATFGGRIGSGGFGL